MKDDIFNAVRKCVNASAIKHRFKDYCGKPMNAIVVNGICYRWDPVYKTYNSVDGNALLTTDDLGVKEAT